MKRSAYLIIAGFCLLTSCNKKNDYESIIHDPLLFSNVVHELNTVVMGNNFSPIVASRNYTYASIAAYEAIAAGYPEKYASLGGQLHGLGTLPKPPKDKKIDFELAAILAFSKLGEAVTFPEGSMSYYTDSLKNLAKDHGMSKEMFNNTVDFADSISAVILAWSKKDNYLETRTYPKYTVIDTPGRWVPTPPAYTSAMEPHWNKIRTLILDSANQFVPPKPPVFNIKDTNSKYYKEVMLIKNAVENLNDEQKHIADFWDDNPFKMNVSGHVMFGTKKFSPPGHWMSIVGIAAKKANYDFAATVYAYAITAITQFDAFIHCWDEKYRSNYARPETVINQYLDADWSPHLQTPPFPEYTCGHSTVSAANAEALTHVFGDNFAYTDTSELEFGIASRSYKSFRDAAVENNWARFYGGIHFHNSCIISTEYGKKTGDFIINHLTMRK
ncbi:MAG TPA: vanadium-dependent haloperoxidase [Chitinophagaceae bacterium]|nr:vanadium-dependent haloperoxidase [Chitinophagaceae bacterium]